MRCMVTGAAGFIASHLIDELSACGADVVGVDRRTAGRVTFVADLADPLAPTPCDLIGEVDAVFHLAARPGVRDRSPDADRMRRRNNVVATARLLELVPRSTPVVVASSSSVYGGAALARSALRPSSEDDPRDLGEATHAPSWRWRSSAPNGEPRAHR